MVITTVAIELHPSVKNQYQSSPTLKGESDAMLENDFNAARYACTEFVWANAGKQKAA